MDIEKCFEILRVSSHSSSDEVKQAYRDLVNVWHPDRFSHNDRLRKKAEEELKRINLAYQEILQFLSFEQERLKVIDLENRTLCSDESCIGIMGPDGRCTECGRRLE